MLAVTSSWQPNGVVPIASGALHGLGHLRIRGITPGAAERPAIDPGLATTVDPRPGAAPIEAARTKPAPIQPIAYHVQDRETLPGIAARFETDLATLLWNNGLTSADPVAAGTSLTILPVPGVLHRVKAGDTIESIARRYGANPDDIVAANALEPTGGIVPGQTIVVAGGRVPMPMRSSADNAGAVVAPTPVPTAVPTTMPTPVPTAEAAPPPQTESLPLPTGATPWQRDFIMTLAPGARESQRKTSVPASVTLAQAILESDWGRSKLTREANNLFGIKALNGPGSAGTYAINTDEVVDDEVVTVLAAFKAYTSLADSIVDHGRWFHENRRYREALKVANDPRAFARAINEAGYATDPAYAPKLIGLMDKFNLYAYDAQTDI
jgi:flagellum-specific peptidoglycan hydrolase FlgJ